MRDSLEAALAVDAPTVESLREGVEITQRQLAPPSRRRASRRSTPLGEKFDPHRHQAMGQVESDQEPNTVVTVLQKGYLLQRPGHPARAGDGGARQARRGGRDAAERLKYAE